MPTRARWIPVAVALVAAFVATSANARTWRVAVSDPACDDAGPGDGEMPLCSIAAAAARVQPGDHVELAAGVYREPLISDVPEVTWQGLGEPCGVAITASVAVDPSSLTAVAGHPRTWSFPVPAGAVARGIHEIGVETDVNRLEPAETSLGDQELGGVMEYWAWHGRTGCGDAPDEYDCPADLAGALDRVDAAEGTFYVDGNTVYVHPRGDREPQTLALELAVRDTSVHLVAPGVRLSGVAIWGSGHGDCSRSEAPGCDDAVVFGGDHADFGDLEVWAARPRLDGSAGLDGFRLSRFLFGAGMNGTALNAAVAVRDLVVEDGEIIGGAANQMLWVAPWGTQDSPVVIQRVVFHEAEIHRWREYWDWRTDSYLLPVTTHGPTFGDCGAQAHDFVFRNNVIYDVGDGIRVFGCTGGCAVLNNTVHDDFGLMVATALPECTVASAPVLARNNLFYTRSELGTRVMLYGPDLGGIDADFDAYLAPLDADGSGTIWALSNGDAHLDFAAVRAADQEVHGLARIGEADGLHDPTASYSGRGGDDYRLTPAATALVDAGDDAHCGHTPPDGHCDIGAYELGFDRSGPSLHRERACTGVPGEDDGGGNTSQDDGGGETWSAADDDGSSGGTGAAAGATADAGSGCRCRAAGPAPRSAALVYLSLACAGRRRRGR